MNKWLFISIYALALALCGCGEKKASGNADDKYAEFESKSHQKKGEEAAMDWNSVNAAREDEDIDFFIQRYGWKAERKGNGLRVEVLEEGSGRKIQSEDIVTLEYTTCLLTGDTVYTSRKLGPKFFKVDKSDEVAGLNEAVKSLRKGGKAHVVIPSFLGYGVAGDGERIRGKVSLAMTIEVTDVQYGMD